MSSHTSSTDSCRWLHLLLRGQTGESKQSECDEYVREFAQKSLDAMHLPILEFRYMNLEVLRVLINGIVQNQNAAPGLIVTSPRAVEAIRRSLDRHDLSSLSTSVDPNLVFAVGPKTAEECNKKLNLECNSLSLTSLDSAQLARTIRSTCEMTDRPIRLVYPKSSLADQTIENALAGIEHIDIRAIIAYETKPKDDIQTILSDAIGGHLARNNPGCLELVYINLIFFSPSGVESYSSKLDPGQLITSLTKRVGKTDGPFRVVIKHSCIGKTTEAALRQRKIDVFCVAEKPNARSLVDIVARNCKP